MLNGDGSGKVVLSGTALITGKVNTNELENVNKTISGAGTISNLTLVNDAAGTIDATGLLVLNTGNTINNAGLLEATAGGNLDVKDVLSNTKTVAASGSGSQVTLEGNVTNTAGTLLATAGGELDVQASTITDNTGGTEQIDTGSELLVEILGHLMLNGDGSGKVVLSGTAQITGKVSSNELENVNKTISGAGTISNLTLVNDAAGTIDATGLLVLNTGHTISKLAGCWRRPPAARCRSTTMSSIPRRARCWRPAAASSMSRRRRSPTILAAPNRSTPARSCWLTIRIWCSTATAAARWCCPARR